MFVPTTVRVAALVGSPAATEGLVRLFSDFFPQPGWNFLPVRDAADLEPAAACCQLIIACGSLSSWQERAVADLTRDGAVPLWRFGAEETAELPTPALWQALAEAPARRCERVVVALAGNNAPAALPDFGVALCRQLSTRGPSALLVETAAAFAALSVAARLQARCLPFGPAWEEEIAGQDVVICADADVAARAAAMLKLTIVLGNSVDLATFAGAPHVVAAAIDDVPALLQRIDMLDLLPRAINWKRAAALACRDTMASWIERLA